ncbi:polyisoprenoid-binding protein [Ktedonobacter sp. SOSP1-85]|uniref:YceI family protein n=1 Tax=unclassified Ktedonobacter TaxID=388461 RepID=UPI00191557BD|nr:MULTISPECIES: YceI family protein [unclassified Ktedonobacter]GHO68528.1 polyisoprenoid-binding protein [Ktedonobacter sp. SOSP1-52]GHO74393.1 polyisoprenoid-binding protein [Ktedonobacter sp. SOSP1-85]
MAWEIDPTHSHVNFSVKHMMFSTVRGSFKVFSGKLHIDEQNPAASWVEAQADTASVDTSDANRDGHLRSADFFDAEQFPVLSFKSTNVERAGDGYKVTGDLTIHGVTKSVVFDAEYLGQGKNPWGATVAGLSATTKINRRDFGLTWSAALETGGVLVGDDVKIEIDLETQNKG